MTLRLKGRLQPCGDERCRDRSSRPSSTVRSRALSPGSVASPGFGKTTLLTTSGAKQPCGRWYILGRKDLPAATVFTHRAGEVFGKQPPVVGIQEFLSGA